MFKEIMVTVLLLLAGVAQAAQTIDHPVTDITGQISEDVKDRVAAKIRQHRAATDVQIAVLVVATTNGDPIQDFSHEVFQQWKGGFAQSDKCSDCGILVTFALSDRKNWISTGYGVEQRVTDAQATQFLRALQPQLRAGNYGGAIERVTDDLIVQTGGTAPKGTAQQRLLEQQPQEDNTALILFLGILGAILVIYILVVVSRNSRGGGSGSSWTFIDFGGGGGGSGSSSSSSNSGGWSGGGGDFGGGGGGGSW